MAAPSTVDLTLVERNDPDVSLGPFKVDDTAVDLTATSLIVEVYFKDSEDQDDDAAGCFKMTSDGDTPDIDDLASDGTCTLHVPASNLPNAASRIWRVDILPDGTKRHTHVTGTLTVMGI